MSEEQMVEVVEPILRVHKLIDLADLENKPEEFTTICLDIIDKMIDALTSSPERTLQDEVLKAIESDLLKITKSLIRLRRTPLQQ